jgi:hypothetical protein
MFNQKFIIMKRIIFIMAAIVLLAFTFTSCNKDSENGTVRLSITDAPIDSENIVGVYITITDIQYNLSGNQWASFSNFEGPQLYNLLDLTHGATELLGNLELEAGTYTQLRFMLDAPIMNSQPHANPGCYLEFADGSTQPLFVPSGSQSGFKGVGAFTVPANGVVEVTADFDVRKSVVKAGNSGKYILKPTIRLVVDNQAGKIVGSVINIPEGSKIVVFAYSEGDYSSDEANDPPVETPRFPNAISSDMVDEEGAFQINFLAPKGYDLIVVSLIDGEFDQVLGIIEGVVVESKKTTTVNIDIDSL